MAYYIRKMPPEQTDWAAVLEQGYGWCDAKADRFCAYDVKQPYNNPGSVNDDMISNVRKRMFETLKAVDDTVDRHEDDEDDEAMAEDLIQAIREVWYSQSSPLTDREAAWLYGVFYHGKDGRWPDFGWDDGKSETLRQVFELKYREPFITGFLPTADPNDPHKFRYFCPKKMERKLKDHVFKIALGNPQSGQAYLFTGFPNADPALVYGSGYLSRPYWMLYTGNPDEDSIKKWAADDLGVSPKEIQILED